MASISRLWLREEGKELLVPVGSLRRNNFDQRLNHMHLVLRVHILSPSLLSFSKLFGKRTTNEFGIVRPFVSSSMHEPKKVDSLYY